MSAKVKGQRSMSARVVKHPIYYLCAPNTITFFDKRNGVLRARKNTQHNILNILIFSSISALLFSYFGMLEQLIWFRMHGTVRLLLEIANF